MIAGIDYGSKMAGTTAIVFEINGILKVLQSEKGKDADLFLQEVVQENNINFIGMDAPLSLPGVFRGMLGKEDYFYRDCDRLLNAMSPMFIGGLTARAMKLTNQFKAQGITVIEAYPKAFVGVSSFDSLYTKKNHSNVSLFLEELAKCHALEIDSNIDNWHQVDGLICWIIARKFLEGKSNVVGNLEEGQIYF